MIRIWSLYNKILFYYHLFYFAFQNFYFIGESEFIQVGSSDGRKTQLEQLQLFLGIEKILFRKRSGIRSPLTNPDIKHWCEWGQGKTPSISSEVSASGKATRKVLYRTKLNSKMNIPGLTGITWQLPPFLKHKKPSEEKKNKIFKVFPMFVKHFTVFPTFIQENSPQVSSESPLCLLLTEWILQTDTTHWSSQLL